MMEHIDYVLLLYVFGVVISLYGFGLFLWWWRKVGSATDVYIYVSLLFGTNAFSDSLALYSRILKINYPDCYMPLLNSWLWGWRRIPELLILFIFVSRMTWRVYNAKQRESGGELLIGQHNITEETREEKNKRN